MQAYGGGTNVSPAPSTIAVSQPFRPPGARSLPLGVADRLANLEGPNKPIDYRRLPGTPQSGGPTLSATKNAQLHSRALVADVADRVKATAATHAAAVTATLDQRAAKRKADAANERAAVRRLAFLHAKCAVHIT